MRDFPRAGSPTITTQICVSSTCTPTPLVFLGRAISIFALQNVVKKAENAEEEMPSKRDV
jgi:hypothetical protein